jgi:hypothetical protein
MAMNMPVLSLSGQIFGCFQMKTAQETAFASEPARGAKNATFCAIYI